MYVWTREGLGQEPASPLLPSSSAAEVQLIHDALGQGLRAENGLTNVVFFARHPERQRRKLMRGEPRLEQLSREWLDIRDRLVRPMKMALAAGRSRAVSKPAVVNVPLSPQAYRARRGPSSLHALRSDCFGSGKSRAADDGNFRLLKLPAPTASRSHSLPSRTQSRPYALVRFH